MSSTCTLGPGAAEAGPDQERTCALRTSGGQETGGRKNNVERQEVWEGCHCRSREEKGTGKLETKAE